MKQSFIHCVAVLLTLTSCSGQRVTAQLIDNPDKALSAAQSFLERASLTYSANQAKVMRRQQQRDSPVVWNVLSNSGEFLVCINGDGKVVGFSDLGVSKAIHDRDPGLPHHVKTDEEAWQIGDRLLQSEGLADMGYQRIEIKKPSDEPGADSNRNNTADRWVLSYGQRVSGLEGVLNSATVEIDVVSGRVEQASASTIWKFKPAQSIMSPEDATARLKGLLAGERTKLGNTGAAHVYDWPGDEVVKRNLHKIVYCGGERCFDSDYGDRLAASWSARPAWRYSGERGTFVIDAETGDPISDSGYQRTIGGLKRLPPSYDYPQSSDPPGSPLTLWVVGVCGIGCGALLTLLFLKFTKTRVRVK